MGDDRVVIFNVRDDEDSVEIDFSMRWPNELPRAGESLEFDEDSCHLVLTILRVRYFISPKPSGVEPCIYTKADPGFRSVDAVRMLSNHPLVVEVNP